MEIGQWFSSWLFPYMTAHHMILGALCSTGAGIMLARLFFWEEAEAWKVKELVGFLILTVTLGSILWPLAILAFALIPLWTVVSLFLALIDLSTSWTANKIIEGGEL